MPYFIHLMGVESTDELGIEEEKDEASDGSLEKKVCKNTSVLWKGSIAHPSMPRFRN